MSQSHTSRHDHNKPVSAIPTEIVDKAITKARTESHIKIMMDKFEAWVINNDLNDFHLETDEDEFSALFYLELNTQLAFYSFCAGYNLSIKENN
ncbi:MAG: hypothetical protein OEY66_07255 [Gammaproteobacteria bacterium]|nr:hypothetical protein [Gammaproteobacteria bacterium]